MDELHCTLPTGKLPAQGSIIAVPRSLSNRLGLTPHCSNHTCAVTLLPLICVSNKRFNNNITIDLHNLHVHEALQQLTLHLQLLQSLPSESAGLG